MAIANVPDETEFGGYDFQFTGSVPRRLYCNVCTRVLRDPHLTECCGQHFCDSCLEHWFKAQKKTTCPQCCQKKFKHMLNKGLQREVDELEIRCTKQRVGCPWVGELSSLQAHLDSDEGCEYADVQCSNKCGAMMMRRELEAHLAQQCPRRKIKCQYCCHKDTYLAITTQHCNECPYYPLPCPNKCGMTAIRRVAMANHRSRCELEPVKCLFHEAGCTVQILRREFDRHMSENQENHLLVLLGAFQEAKRESERKLHNMAVKLFETKQELEEGKARPAEKKIPILKHVGDEVTFRMTDFSLYKQADKVWYSPPFYYRTGYKLCLAVYANGKGVGAGTHVSVELLQMKGEHDHKQKWVEQHYIRVHQNISIQMMVQCKEAKPQGKKFSLERHLCSQCFSRMPPHRESRVCYSTMEGNTSISEDKFIDHQSAEQLMVLNDTIIIVLRVT